MTSARDRRTSLSSLKTRMCLSQVGQLLSWCETHRATASRVHRTDADHTEQTETSNLKFDNGPFRSWWPRRRALVVAAPPGAGGGRAAARRSSLEARW